MSGNLLMWFPDPWHYLCMPGVWHQMFQIRARQLSRKHRLCTYIHNKTEDRQFCALKWNSGCKKQDRDVTDEGRFLKKLTFASQFVLAALDFYSVSFIYFHIWGHFTLSLCHVWVKEIVSNTIFMDYNSNRVLVSPVLGKTSLIKINTWWKWSEALKQALYENHQTVL